MVVVSSDARDSLASEHFHVFCRFSRLLSLSSSAPLFFRRKNARDFESSTLLITQRNLNRYLCCPASYPLPVEQPVGTPPATCDSLAFDTHNAS